MVRSKLGCGGIRYLQTPAEFCESLTLVGFGSEVGDGFLEAFVEGYFGFPAEEFAGAGDVGLALFGVVLGKGFKDEFAFGAGNFEDGFGELEHGHFARVADVHGEVGVAHHEAIDAFDEIGTVAETAGLGPFAENGDWFAGEGLADKCRDDTAVVHAHAGAEGIKDADDAGVDAVLAMVSHGQGFGKALGFVITAAGADGVDVAPIFFGLRMDGWIAVDFGGGSDQKAGAFAFGKAEGFVGAEGADFQGLNRHSQVVDGAGGRGEVPDVIDGVVQKNEFSNVLLNETEIGMAGQMIEVGDGAGDEIVHADDAMAFGEEVIGEVRSQKSR
jgi:hypothetical protein